jgi:hypothetical protein
MLLLVGDLAEINRARAILAEHETVFVARVREVGIGGRGGRLRAWFVKLEIEEVLRGDPFPYPSVVVYVHSPSREFPRHDSKNLAGARCVWAVRREGESFTSAEQLFAFDAPERAVAKTRELVV